MAQRCMYQGFSKTAAMFKRCSMQFKDANPMKSNVLVWEEANDSAEWASDMSRKAWSSSWFYPVQLAKRSWWTNVLVLLLQDEGEAPLFIFLTASAFQIYFFFIRNNPARGLTPCTGSVKGSTHDQPNRARKDERDKWRGLAKKVEIQLIVGDDAPSGRRMQPNPWHLGVRRGRHLLTEFYGGRRWGVWQQGGEDGQLHGSTDSTRAQGGENSAGRKVLTWRVGKDLPLGAHMGLKEFKGKRRGFPTMRNSYERESITCKYHSAN
jgi:hypothetical protein